MTPFKFSAGFPFREITVDMNFSTGIQSLFISMVYIVNTLLCVEVFRAVGRSRVVEFFARNTLIIFIGHMPLIYAFAVPIADLFETNWIGRTVVIVFVFVGLAFLSEGINKIVPMVRLRDKAWSLVSKLFKIKPESS